MSRLFHDNVLVRPIKVEDAVTDGGILIPGGVARVPSQRGIVVACGPEASSIEVGSQVLFGAFAGQPLELNGPSGEHLLVLGFREIIAEVDVSVVEIGNQLSQEA